MTPTLSNQVGILALGRVFAFTVMFFVPMVNVRMLSVEEYGFYRQFWLLYATLVPLAVLGLPRSLLYYFPRVESEREKSVYVTQTLISLLFTSLICWGIYHVMAITLGAGFGELVRTFYWRLVVFTFLMITTEYMETLFVAERMVPQQAIYNALSSLAQSATVILLALTTQDVQYLIWGLVGVAAVRFVLVTGYTIATYRPSLRLVSWASLKEQLSYAVPLGMSSVVLALFAQTDKFIINRFLGREALAVYVIGAFQIPFVTIIRQSITSVIFPLMSQYQKEGRYDDIVELWKRATLKTAVVFFPMFVFLEVVAEPFIDVLFTRKYIGAAPVFAIYLTIFARQTIDFSGIVTAFGQNRYLLVRMWWAFVVNLVLSLVLFKFFGRLGVPTATAITMYLLMFVMIRKGAQLLHKSFFAVLPWGGLGVRMLVAIAPGLLVYFAQQRIVLNSIFDLAIAAVVYFVPYFAIAYALKLVRVEDIKSLFGKPVGKTG